MPPARRAGPQKFHSARHENGRPSTWKADLLTPNARFSRFETSPPRDPIFSADYRAGGLLQAANHR
jgi:hypothetical protein